MKIKRKRLITDVEERFKLPLDFKIKYSMEKIREWYDYYDGKVCVMFSGGKDSTVLLHMAREIYPNISAYFSNTGLEFPEVVSFVKEQKNITWLKPKKHFLKIINEYGYPVISKQQAEYIEQVRNNIHKPNSQVVRLRLTGMTAKNKYYQQFMISKKWQYLINAPFKISARCCKWMKKKPFFEIQKEKGYAPIMGTMASDSQIRKLAYVFNGCNAYKINSPRSAPLSIWTQEDIWNYIHQNNIPYSKIYDIGYSNTGCMFCMFGTHIQQQKTGSNNFLKMAKTHPKLYNYCLDKIGIRQVLDYIKIPY